MGEWLERSLGRTFVLYGERSERFDPGALEEIRRAIGERLRAIPSAGHWVHVDNPDGTIARLTEILESLE
jgi:pimeloyl-ACP methyl ester carboxylesterase